MATTTTATTNFSNLVVSAIRAQAEQELRAKYHFTDPANGFIPGFWEPGTNTIVFPRYADLVAKTTVLTEGTAPTGVALTIDSESISAAQLGNFIEISELAQRQNPHNLFAIAAEKAGAQMALSVHTWVRDVVMAGASVVYANGAARTAVSAAFLAATVRSAVAKLRKTDVQTFADGTYHCVATTEQLGSLAAETASGGWLDVARYADTAGILNGEVGRFAGVRFVDATAQGKVVVGGGATSTTDVHCALMFGPEAYGVCGLNEARAYYNPPGGHDDPLAQLAKIGWKVTEFGALLIVKAGARQVRIESAQTTIS